MRAAAAAAAAAAAPPRAIILMLGDDYGFHNVNYPHAGGGGNPEMRTPNMDALVGEGIILERHYVFKYCSPTRSSLMSGRLPPHVNQNNLCNNIEAPSGVDLRYTMLPAKMREGGYTTAFVGKWHGGARSPANLPINRGFDYHFGFLKGGEDHYSQGSGSKNGEGPGTVDLWSGHALSNETGIYSGYLYASKAVEVITNASQHKDEKLFMYLAWHNTHTPLECPDEFMFPSLPAYNNSFGARMTYNCMARILDAGIGNVTAALKAGGLWEQTLMLFSADNGGWVGNTGSNNYPLRGSKVSDFEGGVRAVAFVSGGYLPDNVRGTVHTGYIAIADWYGTLSKLVGVDPTDDVAGLPPVDSNDFWPSVLVPGASSTGRTDVFLSYSCDGDNASGCDASATSMYGTHGDPTGGTARGDMALISGKYKIIFGKQQGRGIWFGPVYPNGTKDHPAYPCVGGCLFDILGDPTEHVNLKDTLPEVYEDMRQKLLAHGKTLYQTAYKEPGADACLTGPQARAYYVGHNTCIGGGPGYHPSLPNCNEDTPRYYLGPMCFHTLPPGIPPAPPTPAPPAPPPPPGPLTAYCLSSATTLCLTSTGTTKSSTVLGTCAGAAKWTTGTEGFVAWSVGTQYIKLNETGGGTVAQDCARGSAYVNPNLGRRGQPQYQGFTVKEQAGNMSLVSSACPGMCLGFAGEAPQAGAVAAVVDCGTAAPWTTRCAQ